MSSAVCDVCFRHCKIEEGGIGFCGARTCKDGKVACANYGRVTSLALDPIEKKPLRRFYPGSLILSVGSYGCNLRCPFCQNNEISWSDEAMSVARSSGDGAGGPEIYPMISVEDISPEKLAATAEYYKDEGNIGVAFTYNEPLIGYEYVRDAARLVHERGMKNVVVTNGTADLHVLEELAPYVDAMNIDLKGFSDQFYSKILGGDRKMVMDFIEAAVKVCHVELTTLLIPGENDSEEEMEALSAWVAGLKPEPEYYINNGCGDGQVEPGESVNNGCGNGQDEPGESVNNGCGDGQVEPENVTGADIPLHVTRFFPCFHMTDRGPTNRDTVLHLAEVAGRNLKHVYPGNI